MTKRRFELCLEGTVVLELDDELLSEPDEQGRRWTLLDAHEDERRFVRGAEFQDALLALGVILGVENRTLHTDGWADFPTYDDLRKAGVENPYDVLPRAHVDGHWYLDRWCEIDDAGLPVRRDEKGEVIPR